MKTPPPYLHITKKSIKDDKPKVTGFPASDADTYYDADSYYSPGMDEFSSGANHRRMAYRNHAGIVKEILKTKTYRVPIHYFVTVYETIEAKNTEDAILKAQAIEAPPIAVEGFEEGFTEVESEVEAYNVEEIE